MTSHNNHDDDHGMVTQISRFASRLVGGARGLKRENTNLFSYFGEFSSGQHPEICGQCACVQHLLVRVHVAGLAEQHVLAQRQVLDPSLLRHVSYGTLQNNCMRQYRTSTLNQRKGLAPQPSITLSCQTGVVVMRGGGGGLGLVVGGGGGGGGGLRR